MGLGSSISLDAHPLVCNPLTMRTAGRLAGSFIIQKLQASSNGCEQPLPRHPLRYRGTRTSQQTRTTHVARYAHTPSPLLAI